MLRFAALLIACIFTKSSYGQHIPLDLKCPEDSSIVCFEIGTKMYLVNAESKVNWHVADRLCKRYHADLVTLETADELTALSSELQDRNLDIGNYWFWTSVNDLGSEGKFYSLTTGLPPPYFQWSRHQPDNAGGGENCVHLWRRGNFFVMNDLHCFAKINFICERKSVPIDIR